jgi:diguanylate cyclase (GGDEF)-like protein
MLNLVNDPEIGAFLLQLTLANQESSTVEAFDAAAVGADVTVIVASLLASLESGGTGAAVAAVFDRGDHCLAASPSAPISVGDTRTGEAWTAISGDRLDLAVVITSPQTGEHLGVLELCSNYPDLRPFTRNLAHSIASRVALVLDGERNRRDLRRQADFDALTGVYNRRAAFERLHAVTATATVSVAYLDVNRFKDINDHYGHDAGDDVLVAVARRLERAAGPGDIVARLGGDEFLVVRVVRDGEALNARVLAAAVDGQVRTGEASVCISCSVGVSTGLARRVTSLLADADRAMYAHKNQPRAEAERGQRISAS